MKRLGVVVVVAVVGFAAAFVAFRGSAERGCLVQVPRDASYDVAFAEPVRMDRTTHVVSVTRNGEPVTGARVCVNVDMVGMSAMAAGAEAVEVEPGRYEVPLVFEMGGPWQGKVLIASDGNAWDVSVPVRFDVMSGGMPMGDAADGGADDAGMQDGAMDDGMGEDEDADG